MSEKTCGTYYFGGILLAHKQLQLYQIIIELSDNDEEECLLTECISHLAIISMLCFDL